MELAAIGKSEFVTGFRLAGIRKIYETSDVTSLESAVKSVLADKSVGIVVMHNDDISNLPEILTWLEEWLKYNQYFPQIMQI